MSKLLAGDIASDDLVQIANVDVARVRVANVAQVALVRAAQLESTLDVLSGVEMQAGPELVDPNVNATLASGVDKRESQPELGATLRTLRLLVDVTVDLSHKAQSA